jgi:CheY-like chemotaxis protein
MLSGIEGYTIYKAGSVKESIGILEQNPIDLVISDIGLPDGSGTEIMEHVRGQGSNVPGIAISGYSSEDDVQNSKDAGFQMHLVKPMDMGQLEQQIKELTKPEQDK